MPPPARPYRFWGRGRGVPRQPDGSGECHLFLAVNRLVFLGNWCFSWWEIAWPPLLLIKRVFFKSLACLATRFILTEVKFRTWQKISNIYKWKEIVQKNTQLSFCWKVKISSYEICLRGIHLCFRFCCKLGSAQRLSLQHLVRSTPNTKYSRASAFCFFCPQPWFLQWSEHIFPGKTPACSCPQRLVMGKGMSSKEGTIFFSFNNLKLRVFSQLLISTSKKKKCWALLLGLAKSIYYSFFHFKPPNKMVHKRVTDPTWKQTL